MSKKVLILSASPRKGGNSDVLCDQFILGAEEKGIIYATGLWKKGDLNGNVH